MMQLFGRLLRVAVLGLAVTLTACGGGGDSSPAATTPTDSGQVTTSTLRSTNTGFPYAIQVWVPASYATGTSTLPAIYVTEGDAPYGGATGAGFGGANQSRFDTFKLAMQRHGTQAILVGISGTARRDTDFLLPTAANYLAFISKELAPSIEQGLRADPKRRALSGLSHGGYFVVAALVLEAASGTPTFSHYLSTESSYGANTGVPAYLDYVKQFDALDKPMATTLFLAGARQSNGPVVVAPLYNQMAAHPHAGFTLLTSQYDTSHVGADVPAFEESLTRFFP